MRSIVCALGAILLAGCTSMTPPPMLLGHGAPRGDRPGTTSLHVSALGASAIFEEMAAGGARLRYQVSEQVAIGAQFDVGSVTTGGLDLGRGEETIDAVSTLAAGRLSLHFRPEDAENTRIAFGIGGGGVEHGLRYGTVDGAIFFGSGGSVVRVYGGPLLALAIPIEQWDLVEPANEARTTVYGGAAGGIEFSFTEYVSLSLETSLGLAAHGGSQFFGSLGGTLGLRLPGS